MSYNQPQQQPMSYEKQGHGVQPDQAYQQSPQPYQQQGHTHQQPSQPYQQPAQAYQHAHQGPSKWSFGTFDCCSPFSTCFLTCCCPCVTFGRISAREDGETDPSGINGACCIYALLLHFGAACCLQWYNRGKLRNKYNIEGNGFTDCLTSCCCHCCNLIQEDKETIVRNTGINPKTDQPYAPPQNMTYP